MRRTVVLTLCLICSAAVAAPAGAAGAPSVWSNRSGNVTCGIESAKLSAKFVLCSTRGLPRPSHSPVGDPFVELAATGAPRIVLLSQDSFPAGARPRTLGSGALWGARDVVCHVESTSVTCFNTSNHGFRISPGHFRAF